jgi:hypothetical protein
MSKNLGVNMNCLEIYKETQNLAGSLAAMNGFFPHSEGDYSMFKSNTENTRAAHYFDMAVMAQIQLKGHEMQDIVDSVEDDET